MEGERAACSEDRRKAELWRSSLPGLCFVRMDLAQLAWFGVLKDLQSPTVTSGLFMWHEADE